MSKDSQTEVFTNGFNVTHIKDIIHEAEALVIDKLTKIKGKAQDEVNIGDLFDMQWMMNKLSQLSEMSSAVLAAAHQSVSAMNRNIK